MDIKRINGVISTYSANRSGNVKKTEASASVKNMDRVEFGFETALKAAKNGIASEVRADATEQEINDLILSYYDAYVESTGATE